MKHLIKIGLLLAFSSCALISYALHPDNHGFAKPCAHHGFSSGDLPKPLLDEMDEFGAKISEAFWNKDIDAIMDCYWNSPDVQLIAMGDYVRGTEAVRQATLAVFAFPGTVRNECLSIKYTRVGELILVVGTERNTLTPADGGAPTIMNLIWSDVRKKIDGKWVMLVNHVTLLP